MAPPPKTAIPKPDGAKPWTEKISRSGYFFGALMLHIVVFLMVATLVIFPAFHPPTDDFKKTYVPASAPPPPPPQQQQTVDVPSHAVSVPTTAISSPNPTASFNIPLPELSPQTTPVDLSSKMSQKIESKPVAITGARLAKIMETEQKWGRDRNNILQSGGDPHNVVAKFPLFLASYADGDWGCNVRLVNGNISEGSLPNLVEKINEWSHGKLTGSVVPQPLNIGGPELMDKRPPFVFFTGHKDFHLTEAEVKNLADYLQVGGCIWGDNSLAGRGSRFDIAFRREMKRVVPDIDKNFEPVDMTDKLFMKSWYPITKLPTGMNYYAEPIEHLDIDGKLAILYTPNDYGDMFTMRILPGDDKIMGWQLPKHWTGARLTTFAIYLQNRSLFFRNYSLESCLACQQLGMNIIGHLLVRFDDSMLLAPP